MEQQKSDTKKRMLAVKKRVPEKNFINNEEKSNSQALVFLVTQSQRKKKHPIRNMLRKPKIQNDHQT